MNNKFTKSILLTLFIFLFWLNALCQIVCPKNHIVGFEKEHQVANIFIGSANTTIASQSKIYITLQNEAIYIQSNFKPSSASEYPIKMATPPQKGYNKLENYLENIYFFGDEYAPEPNISKAFFDKIKKEIDLTVDPSVLHSADFSNLGFENFTNLKIACPDNTARDTKVLFDSKGKVNEFLIKSSENISLRIKNQDINLMLSDIKKIKWDPERLRLISLVENEATKESIKKNFAKYSLPVSYDKDVLKSTLLENKGNFNIILGHTENDKFVTVNSRGKVLFEISLSELRNFQKENKLRLLLIGCNSGASTGTGTINKFNSTDFLDGLKLAEKMANMDDFLKKMCEGNFDFVIDETFFTGQNEVIIAESEKQIVEMNIKVYKKSKDDKIYKPTIGEIILLLPASETLTSNSDENDTITSNDNHEADSNDYIPNNDPKNDHRTLYTFILLGALGAGYIIFKSKKRK